MEQDSLFGESEEELETPDHKAGREAHEILERWYPLFYKDMTTGEVFYTQNPGMIMKCMKGMLAKGISPFYLEWAMNILGQDAKPINDYSIQQALAIIRREENKNSIDSFRVNDSETKEYGEYL